MKIGIIGSGNVGMHMASLLAGSGHEIMIGERTPSSGEVTLPHGSFGDTIQFGDIILLAIPFSSCKEALSPLAEKFKGKIVIDATNPLNADWSPLLLGEENSAAEELARLLPQAMLVKSFNTIFADMMTSERIKEGTSPITAFIAGDYNEANTVVADIATSIGLYPLLVGPLKCARYLEAMAHLNIQIAVGMGHGTYAALLYKKGNSNEQ